MFQIDSEQRLMIWQKAEALNGCDAHRTVSLFLPNIRCIDSTGTDCFSSAVQLILECKESYLNILTLQE